jgi:peptidoglycan/xylan/chitin deacetylase (PgdA/CDA1 family)
VAPKVRTPAPLNPDNSFSRDISGSSQISWSRGSSNSRHIALTFDDGPVAANTTRVLDMLKRRNIKATFYVIGERVQRNPALTRRIVAEGHEIGNHTWTHGKLTSMSDTKVRWELDKTRDAVVAATGVKPRTMRPPYGALRSSQRSWIFREYGYPTILWNVDPEDWKKPGVSVVRNRILSGTNNGSIILLHDLHKSSVDAVPSTVDALLRRGYKFVTVSQLIALNNKEQ